MEDFDPTRYGPEVARILALDGNGRRLIPLTSAGCSSEQARTILKTSPSHQLFPGLKAVAAPVAGLWTYFSCFAQAHELASASGTQECELWHAILHRQEPDAGNAAYWFRKAGPHPSFAALAREANRILKNIPEAEFSVGDWDPLAFVTFCERARGEGGPANQRAALEIQRAEWQILFDYCARPR